MGKKGVRKKAIRVSSKRNSKPARNTKAIKQAIRPEKKAKPAKTRQEPKNEALLKDVPTEYSFWLSDGRIIKNAEELANAAATMTEDVYTYHANSQKNDFADWIRDIIQDQPLSYQIRKANSPQQMQKAIYRMIGQKPRRQEMPEPQTTVISAQPPEPHEQEQIQAQEPLTSNEQASMPQIPQQLTPAQDNNPTKDEKESTEEHKPETMREKDAFRHETKKHGKSQSKKHHQIHKHNHQKPHTQDIRKDANDEMAELRRIEEQLLQEEKGLSEEEQRLNSAKLELTKKRYELLKQRGELEKKKFEYFLSKRTSPELTAQINNATHPRSLEFREKMPLEFGKERLEQLIRQAKQDIAQGNAEEATRKFHEIESTFSRSILTPDEKRSLKYEIMEIEADIRLAAISHR
ncbi:hypothetical protein HY640_03110 [Candidatus Woesearchaeota archaeon]|nr:hypothetical protein [Candidatus Woesearchaeota archaeon]